MTQPTAAPAWADPFVEHWGPDGAAVLGYWRTLTGAEQARVTLEVLGELCAFLARTLPFEAAWLERQSSCYEEVTWYAEHAALPHPARLRAWLNVEELL